MEIKTEIKVEEFKKLNAGDVVYLTGTLVTARDKAHMRALKLIREGRIEEIPEELLSFPVYHCGPLLKNGKIVSAGPTTSARMNDLSPAILELTSCPVIVGKGGMNEKVVEKLRGRGCYLAFPGGAGALAAKCIKKIEKVYWSDLGMAEAIYILKVENFGPCVVAIDCKGVNLYR